jgi:hypothetical protein
MMMAKGKWLVASAVFLAMACAAFAQADPFGSGSFGIVSDAYASLMDKIMSTVAASVLPLPGHALMNDAMCASTGNSLLDTVVFKAEIFSLSALAAVAGAMFLAFVFILGKIMDNKKWVEYAKNELLEMGITIFVVLIILLPMMKVIGCYNVFEPGTTTYEAAFAYPKDILASLTPFSIGLYLVNAVGQNLILRIQVVQNVFVQSAGGFGAASEDATLGTSSTAGMAIVVTSALASLMAYLHEFVTYGFMVYLLPLGLVLRFFPPTRRIGGTIIALTFGMGILVPFMFAIGHSVIAKGYFPFYYDISGSAGLQQGCFKVPGTEICANTHILENGMSELSGRFAALSMANAETASLQDTHLNEATAETPDGGTRYETTASVANEPWFIAKLFSMLLSSIAVVFQIMVLSSGGGVLCFGGTIYPLIVSIILINGVKYMSSTLGEEIDVSNLSRLI